MGSRTMVVQSRPRLPKMAKPQASGLILGSPSHLGVCIVCTYGTPVADVLAHSPPLPLIIDYFDDTTDTAEEEGILLALEQRNCVRRIRVRLRIAVLNLPKFMKCIEVRQ
jgi:hypothetical protein